MALASFCGVDTPSMTSASWKGSGEVNSRLPQAGESQMQTFHWSSLSIKTHNVKLTASGTRATGAPALHVCDHALQDQPAVVGPLLCSQSWQD